MREIKFKGLRKDTHEPVFGSYVSELSYTGETFPGYSENYLNSDIEGAHIPRFVIIDESGLACEVNLSTVKQFTGMYDDTKWEELSEYEQSIFLRYHVKEDWKGREIYSGDILRIEEDSHRGFLPKGTECKVDWDEKELCYKIQGSYRLTANKKVKKIK